MPQIAANLTMLFNEVPFLDRFEAAAKAGFKAVEFQVPYDYPGAELKARLDAHGLKMVLFDAPMGNWSAGDRGLAAVPGREAEFRESLPRAAEYAAALACDLVHVMAGVVGPEAGHGHAQAGSATPSSGAASRDPDGFEARVPAPRGPSCRRSGTAARDRDRARRPPR